MKSHPWDELNDGAKDFFDSAGLMPEIGIEDDIHDKRLQRRRLTELRRRTEERLDWKRAYGDLQFDDLDRFDESGEGRSAAQRFSLDDYGDAADFDEH